MNFGIEILKGLKGKGELNNLLQNFITHYVEVNGNGCVEILNYNCKQNASKDAYNVTANVNTSYYYTFPLLRYKMVVADNVCFISENGRAPKNISKNWNDYCLSELNENQTQTTIKRVGIK